MSPYYAAWEDATLECLSLYIEPDFLCRTAHEVIDPARIELLGQARLPDPLIGGVMMSLQREYDRHGSIEKLYAESLSTALSVHTLKHYTTITPDMRSIAERLTRTDCVVPSSTFRTIWTPICRCRRSPASRG